ncbi:hypothetical protein H2204_006515 [Knufia peltigerae]|uniref:Zn(2)-C6 fungal-type domain-containing protein n=1 Tax=Knufia peltigerae TaxID=1002370 RepID=A0AA38Y433_9EURO|nr:hypothetical protein H2204_006515 [Knufia peltigerae]
MVPRHRAMVGTLPARCSESEPQMTLPVLTNTPGRRPIRRACADCHARKVKCDGATRGFPCSNCRSAHVDCCITERRKRRKLSDSSRPSTQQGRRRDVEAGDISPGRPAPAYSYSFIEAGSDDQHAPNTATSGWVAVANPDVNRSDQGDTEADQPPVPGNDEYAGESELARRHLTDFFNQDLQTNPIKARSTYVGSELSNLYFLTRQRSAEEHVYHYPCSNVYVPRGFRSSQTSATPNLIPKDAFVLPPGNISAKLIDAYFTHVHPMFPVIDKEKFLEQYQASDSAPPILLMQAICLVGSHMSTFHNIQNLKVAFFRRAKALLDGRYEEDRMHTVQAALLLTWFSDGGDDICANAWWWIGVAARVAVGLGMHRDVTHSKMPESDKRIWKVIWWCLVQFDCLVSLSFGRPLAINLDDCDVRPLQASELEPSITPEQAKFVVHHAKLCETISDLIHSYFTIKARKSGSSRKDALEVVDSALAKWAAELPPAFREQTTHGIETSPFPLLLHLTYNTVLLQFHRQSLVSASDSGIAMEFSSDEEICADAASNIVRIFQQLREQSVLQYCCFWTSSSLFAAMLHVSGELKCSNRILNLRSKEKYESALKSLSKLAGHWISASSVLRLFQSSKSGHLFNKASHVQPTSVTSPPRRQGIDDDRSNAEMASPVELRGLNSQPYPDQARVPLQEMDWVQPASFSEVQDFNNSNMHIELNRWQNNMDDWQSIYWSDPLSMITLGDNSGIFDF